ncbi:voltage-gated purine nucleotide uniporter SLC17A9 isoform X2 [Zootoca vivipara]|uniref:voltage-gated purine nucleotide uniporter SLC17A9 isoform X2 n=1 Tax=Zootoca vivipara TaxID=8524 RepID=UPI00293B93FA|nr:voltage-gated purine nucleotide uniporter SLC17A9 isoform X2 [Zootoca vivipara]
MALSVSENGAQVCGADLSLHHLKQQLKSTEEGMKKDGADSYWSRPESRIWTIALLLGTCLLYCTRVALPISVAAMSAHFDWDKRQSGIVLSSFFWGYCLTQIAGGHLSDRIGGEKVILLSASVWGSITAITPLLTYVGSAQLVLIAFSRFLMGLLQGVYFPALASLFSRKVRENERAFTYSTVGTGSQFGTLVMGAAGSLLLDWYGWKSVFYFSGALTLLWVYCMCKYLMNGKELIIPLEGLAKGLSLRKQTKVPWKQIFKKAPVWAVITAQLCAAGSFFTLLSWLPTFFKETFPDSKGWVFNVVPWLVAIPTSLFSGFLSDQFINQGHWLRGFQHFCRVHWSHQQFRSRGCVCVGLRGTTDLQPQWHLSQYTRPGSFVCWPAVWGGKYWWGFIRCCLCVPSWTSDRNHRFMGICFQSRGSSKRLWTLYFPHLWESPQSGHRLCLCRTVGTKI